MDRLARALDLFVFPFALLGSIVYRDFYAISHVVFVFGLHL